MPIAIDSDELRRIYLLSGLDDDQLQSVVERMRVISLDEGQILFDFGQPAQRFFYVRSGQVKLYRTSPEGAEKVIWIIQPRTTFAEAVMFMEVRCYPVSAAAIVPSEVLAFDNNTMLKILRGSIETCFRLMAAMSQRLHQQVDEIDKLTLHDATFRLASYLLHEAAAGGASSPELVLTAPKNVVASHLSIQPETFSRILARMKRKGLLEVHGQSIVIKDMQGLRNLTENR